MVRTSGLLVAISVLTTAVLTSLAVTQGGQGDQLAKNRSGSEATTEFRFEVLSIHPIEREASGSLGVTKPTLNGFSARALVYQLVLAAYGPPSAILRPNRAFTEVRNLPNWYGEVYAFEARVSQADLKAWQSQGKNYDLLRAALQAALK